MSEVRIIQEYKDEDDINDRESLKMMRMGSMKAKKAGGVEKTP